MFDSPLPLRLRPFRLADAGSVEPWLNGDGLSLPGGQLRREWPQRLLADRRIVASVAWSGRSRVGLVRLDCGPDGVAEITLVVAPECRRRGLGRGMLAEAADQAARLGMRRLYAAIERQNRTAAAFFAELGFEAAGVVGDRVRFVRLLHVGYHTPPLDVR
jgi:GNAT superfamily N-acetyltransferase